MKRKRIIIIFTIIIFVVLVLFYISNENKHIDINMQVKNNTNKNQNIDISVLLGLEDSSASNKIISISMIASGAAEKKKMTVNTPEGDFGLVLSIDESTEALYFSRGSMLSYVNYNIEIIDSSNGNIILKGDVTSKGLLGFKKTQEIKPIIIKGNKYEK